jgi:hypothetical protein
MALLHAGVGRRWRGGYRHQSQTLQQKDGTLRGATPDELATVALAVLDVDVTAAVLQTAILEDAINKDAFVQNHVLVLEGLTVVSIHFMSAACGSGGLVPLKLTSVCTIGRGPRATSDGRVT